MKNLLKFPALVAVLLVTAASLLTSCVATVPATTAVVVRPRPYYRPAYRPYYRPAPVVVAPRPIIVTPAPRPYYNYRPHRYYRVR
ncbi:hypothetical protein [Hymenobacter rigui]|uniref:Uncharacterized protein n=1 Tax=Hymenobacter rigui TaxID=334424 RepID=A0A3R9MU59_9BACT|nr:hypothetical protein [Hymenobacter rigui]RSK48537.1 hypothetical protein EI291_12535 [Hymenobacter rigui]